MPDSIILQFVRRLPLALRGVDLRRTTKMFLNLSGNIFASWQANFVSAAMFPEVGKQGNIDRKHNASAAMFRSLPRALVVVVGSIQNYIDLCHALQVARNIASYHMTFN